MAPVPYRAGALGSVQYGIQRSALAGHAAAQLANHTLTGPGGTTGITA